MKTRILLPVLFIFGLLMLLLTGCPLNPNGALTVKIGSQVIENTGTYDFGIIDRYNLPTGQTIGWLAEESFTIENSGNAPFNLTSAIENSDTSAIKGEPIFNMITPTIQVLPGSNDDLTVIINDYHIQAGIEDLSDYIAPGAKSATVLISDQTTGEELYRFSVTATLSPSKSSVGLKLSSSSATTSTYGKAALYSISTSEKRASTIGPQGVAFGFETSIWSNLWDPITGAHAAFPIGAYAMEVYLDQNGDYTLNTGEKGYTAIIDITGDTVLTVGDSQLIPAVTEGVTATAGVGNGVPLICVWHYPGTTIDAFAALSADITGFSTGSATTDLHSAIIPGTYDLYCYADADSGTNLGTDPITWDNDSGEYEYSALNVTVTGAGTAAGTFTPK